jgi:hypothetical protein
MKEITLPKELLNLPQPWGLTRPDERREQLPSLSYDTGSIKTALNVLERSLHSLSQLTYSEKNGIPEEMITYWTFSAQWLAERIPAFDDFKMDKVKQFLIHDERIDSPSPELIFDVAEYWIWWITWDIERAVLYWVENALMTNREPIFISRFLYIAKRYWQKIKPRMGLSLLSASAMIGQQKALPLLDFVEQQPEAPELLKETARDYREFVLDNPHKWLPDSEDKEELAAAKSKPMIQLAFGQLVPVG